MKRLLSILLVLMMSCPPALAETQVFCAGSEGDASYAISQCLADALNGTVVTAPTECDAINAFLAADRDSAVFIGGPSTMILSLQGYTDADLRTAVVPVAKVAASAATVYATQAVCDLCPDVTENGLLAYSEQAPFELFIARLIDASPEDFLTLEATAAFYVDQNLYMDWAEMAQAIQDGSLDLCVFGANVPDELNGLLIPLYTAAQEGPFLGAFVQADAAHAAEVEAALLTLSNQADVQAMLEAAGYIPGSQAEASSFAEEVRMLFQTYIRYLTNEGLFFYEF